MTHEHTPPRDPGGWPAPGPGQQPVGSAAQPPHPVGWPQHGPVAPAPQPSKAGILSTVALWVGIGALCASLIPIVGLIGVLVGVAALIIGVVAAFIERSRGRAIAGMVLGAVAVPLGLAITLATGGALVASLAGSSISEDVVAASALLDEEEYASDDCVSVEFEAPAGSSVDYTVSNTCDHATPAAIFVVDAVDAHGHVIASGWGDSESLDVTGSGSTCSSYVMFDDDVSRGVSFDIRDLDANNALAQTWWYGEDTTIEA